MRLPITRMGNPILRKKAIPFTPQEIVTPSTRELIRNMTDTLRETNAGIGLAAPQVNVNKQLLIVHMPQAHKPLPLTAIFNPRLEFMNKRDTFFLWESCLSVPGLIGRVNRYKYLTMSFLDEEANQRTIRASGYIAGLLQHETDHLFGKLYIDRMNKSDLESNLLFEEEFLKFKENDNEGWENGDWEYLT